MTTAPAQQLSRVGVGASEIAAACGIHKYKTRFGLWLEKTGRKPPFAGNHHTRLGQLCEPRARQLYANATGCDIVTPAASMFHPEHNWCRATPDGWRADNPKHGVQIKSVGFYVGRRWKHEIPIYVEAQCQWEMFVTGAETWDLAVLEGTDEIEWERFIFGEVDDPAEVVGKMTLAIYPIARNDRDIAALFAGGRAFMDLVERDEQPPVDHSDDARDYWNGRRPTEVVALKYDDHAALVDELARAHAEHKAAERRLATAKNATREALALAGANRITTDDGPIIWTANKQLRVPPGWNSEEET